MLPPTRAVFNVMRGQVGGGGQTLVELWGGQSGSRLTSSDGGDPLKLAVLPHF